MSNGASRGDSDHQPDLFGSQATTTNSSPGIRISGEVVFERMMTGVRVSARDSENRLLWGFVAADDTLKEIHTKVAMYDRLLEIIDQQLRENGFPAGDASGDAMEEAAVTIGRLRAVVDQLEASLVVKKVTKETRKRAHRIAGAVDNARRQIQLELPVTGEPGGNGEGTE